MNQDLLKRYDDYFEVYDKLFNIKLSDSVDEFYQLVTNFFNKYRISRITFFSSLMYAVKYNYGSLMLYIKLFNLINENYPISQSLLSQKLLRSMEKYLHIITQEIDNSFPKEDEIGYFIMFDQIDKFKEYAINHSVERLRMKYSAILRRNSILENCAYFGSVNIFNFLLTNSGFKITSRCLRNAIIGGNTDIINECMKSFQIDRDCFNCAIGSHNNKFFEYILNQDLVEFDKVDFETIFYSQNLKALFLMYGKDPNSIVPWCLAFPETIDIIKSGNINFTKTDSDNKTLLHYSSMYACNDITQFLLDSRELNHININARDRFHKSALDYAAAGDSNQIAELLLKNGAEINSPVFLQPALYYSIINKNKQMTELLLSFGADTNILYNGFNTILSLAIDLNCKEIVELLISHGADLKDRNGDSALARSARYNNIEIVKLLLSHGVKVKGSGGNRALYESISNNCTEVAKLLILYGADPTKNYGFETNLGIAIQNCNKELVEILISNGVDVNT
ncbi:hypothetical protein TVAG_452600 [Trichomonas vaginalis G3]|uniref:DUF3447 domain-containing protein n=1 Tax=Trichomonas vaginalis (strain ATCC PRA-98 / G3) TaxID=412133 RepID=A2DJY2_TRIV3|nr:temperature-gated cation channel protein [Trichomonas vaginalis G3]EAY19346.1 hypothetical protein TVAG_452600 [Trichomonas vaginalis G3]KAI5527253.1 temperature-gated cation channel protein [Trichomonas vaginalis G3]|eukprot:XP_001580332.1 hypothetical protein [Trichomonas vaginalis G3]